MLTCGVCVRLQKESSAPGLSLLRQRNRRKTITMEERHQQASAAVEETGDFSRRQQKAQNKMQVTKQTCSFGSLLFPPCAVVRLLL